MKNEQRNPFPRHIIKPEASGQTAAQKRAAADYMADMALQMRNLAKAWNHRTLQSLFEIAYYEAFHLANAIDVPEEEIARIDMMVRASNDRSEH